MSFLNDIKQVVGTVAPTVGAIIGGPFGSIAGQTLGRVLLGDATASEAEIVSAVQGLSGADLAKLKVAEAELKAELAAAGVKLEEIAADDRDSARRMRADMNDWTPAILGGLILIGFFAMLYVMMKYELPENTKEIMMVMVGALGGMAIQVVNFFFGSSAGSSRKNSIIEKLKAGS